MKRLPLASLGHGPCARSRGYSVTTRASPASFEPGLGQGYCSSSRRRRPSGEGADCRAVTDAPCGANPCRRSTGPGEPGTAAPTWELVGRSLPAVSPSRPSPNNERPASTARVDR